MDVRILEDYNGYAKDKILTISTRKYAKMQAEKVKMELVKGHVTGIRKYEFEQAQKPWSAMTKEELIKVAKDSGIEVNKSFPKKEILALLGVEEEDK